MFLTCHGKMSIMVDTIVRAQDDILHFLMHVASIIAIFGFLGHWSFGVDDPRFGTMQASVYLLFQFLCGEFNFAETIPSAAMSVYLVCAIFMLSWVLLNFLMAIIIDAYESVKDAHGEMDIENDILQDIMDCWITVVTNHFYHWPSQSHVLIYLHSGEALASVKDEDPIAVTPEELYCNVFTHRGERYFQTYQRACMYIDFYAQKRVASGGRFSMQERREERQVPLNKLEELRVIGNIDVRSAGKSRRAKSPKQELEEQEVEEEEEEVQESVPVKLSDVDEVERLFGRDHSKQTITPSSSHELAEDPLFSVVSASEEDITATDEAPTQVVPPNLLKDLEDIRAMVTDIHEIATKVGHAFTPSQSPTGAPIQTPTQTPMLEARLEADRTISSVAMILDENMALVRQTLIEAFPPHQPNPVKESLEHGSRNSVESSSHLQQNGSNGTSTFDEAK